MRVEIVNDNQNCGHPTSVSIGLQYGPIWAGTIGISRRFGPTPIGDAVNVATRLEQQARRLDAQVVVGNEVIQRAQQESGSHACELERFGNVGPVFVHGRTNPIHVWKLQTRSTELMLNNETDVEPHAGNRSAKS
jgi:class 3 adenylate cyclase